MPQRQHIISRWLLDRFARDASGGRTISVLDKTTAASRDDVPTRFMTVVDDHSDDIEAALGRLENSTAPAAARLAGRASNVAPGVWPLAGTTDNLAGDGELHELPDRQTAEMRLFTFDRWLADSPIQDRQAISAFPALMYTRSRKTERMILAAREEVMRAYASDVGVRDHRRPLLRLGRDPRRPPGRLARRTPRPSCCQSRDATAGPPVRLHWHTTGGTRDGLFS